MFFSGHGVDSLCGVPVYVSAFADTHGDYRKRSGHASQLILSECPRLLGVNRNTVRDCYYSTVNIAFITY